MAGFIGVSNPYRGSIGNQRFSAINRSTNFPYAGSGFSTIGGQSGFGNFGSFGSFGGGFGNPYAFGGNIGGFGGAGAWGAFAASIGFLIGTMITNMITARREGGDGQECGECGGHETRLAGHPDMQYNHQNYVDGPSEHRWDDDGYNVSFDVDYA